MDTWGVQASVGATSGEWSDVQYGNFTGEPQGVQTSVQQNYIDREGQGVEQPSSLQYPLALGTSRFGGPRMESADWRSNGYYNDMGSEIYAPTSAKTRRVDYEYSRSVIGASNMAAPKSVYSFDIQRSQTACQDVQTTNVPMSVNGVPQTSTQMMDSSVYWYHSQSFDTPGSPRRKKPRAAHQDVSAPAPSGYSLPAPPAYYYGTNDSFDSRSYHSGSSISAAQTWRPESPHPSIPQYPLNQMPTPPDRNACNPGTMNPLQNHPSEASRSLNQSWMPGMAQCMDVSGFQTAAGGQSVSQQTLPSNGHLFVNGARDPAYTQTAHPPRSVHALPYGNHSYTGHVPPTGNAYDIPGSALSSCDSGAWKSPHESAGGTSAIQTSSPNYPYGPYHGSPESADQVSISVVPQVFHYPNSLETPPSSAVSQTSNSRDGSSYSPQTPSPQHSVCDDSSNNTKSSGQDSTSEVPRNIHPPGVQGSSTQARSALLRTPNLQPAQDIPPRTASSASRAVPPAVLCTTNAPVVLKSATATRTPNLTLGSHHSLPRRSAGHSLTTHVAPTSVPLHAGTVHDQRTQSSADPRGFFTVHSADGVTIHTIPKSSVRPEVVEVTGLPKTSINSRGERNAVGSNVVHCQQTPNQVVAPRQSSLVVSTSSGEYMSSVVQQKLKDAVVLISTQPTKAPPVMQKNRRTYRSSQDAATRRPTLTDSQSAYDFGSIIFTGRPKPAAPQNISRQIVVVPRTVLKDQATSPTRPPNAPFPKASASVGQAKISSDVRNASCFPQAPTQGVPRNSSLLVASMPAGETSRSTGLQSGHDVDVSGRAGRSKTSSGSHNGRNLAPTRPQNSQNLITSSPVVSATTVPQSFPPLVASVHEQQTQSSLPQNASISDLLSFAVRASSACASDVYDCDASSHSEQAPRPPPTVHVYGVKDLVKKASRSRPKKPNVGLPRRTQSPFSAKFPGTRVNQCAPQGTQPCDVTRSETPKETLLLTAPASQISTIPPGSLPASSGPKDPTTVPMVAEAHETVSCSEPETRSPTPSDPEGVDIDTALSSAELLLIDAYLERQFPSALSDSEQQTPILSQETHLQAATSSEKQSASPTVKRVDGVGSGKREQAAKCQTDVPASTCTETDGTVLQSSRSSPVPISAGQTTNATVAKDTQDSDVLSSRRSTQGSPTEDQSPSSSGSMSSLPVSEQDSSLLDDDIWEAINREVEEIVFPCQKELREGFNSYSGIFVPRSKDSV